MKAILTSKRGADGTLRSQFMLFCVITSHYGTGDSLFLLRQLHKIFFPKISKSTIIVNLSPLFINGKIISPCLPGQPWVLCPGLLVIIWRHWAAPVSRVRGIDHQGSHNCDICDAVTMIHLVSGAWPAPTCPHKYSSISFLTSQPSQARLGQGNEIWYKLNIKSIFCWLSASVRALGRLRHEWWELLLSSI